MSATKQWRKFTLGIFKNFQIYLKELVPNPKRFERSERKKRTKLH